MRIGPWLLALAVAAMPPRTPASPVAGPVPPVPATEAPSRDPGEPSRVVTPLDYFMKGQETLQAYLDHGGSERTGHGLADVIASAKRACVQVEVRLAESESRYESVRGTGVVLGEGRFVLTAGHTVAGNEGAQIVLTRPTGETCSATLLRFRYDPSGPQPNDWALLRVVGPPLPYSVLRGSTFRDGSEVLVLGYPEQIGLDKNGRAAYAEDAQGVYLDPLATLAVVEDSKAVRLTPSVGALAAGGMSGGPILDREGRLLGIFVSLSRGTRDGKIRHVYNAVPYELLSDLPAALRPTHAAAAPHAGGEPGDPTLRVRPRSVPGDR